MIIIGPIIAVRKWPLSILALWVATVWFLPLLYRELLATRALHQEAGARVVTAEDALRRETEQKSSLKQELEKVTKALREAESELLKESQKPRPMSGATNPTFRRVGLDADCPRWVAEAVRKEYRKRLHPDLQPAARRSESEKRLKDAEAVFHEVWRLRGFER